MQQSAHHARICSPELACETQTKKESPSTKLSTAMACRTARFPGSPALLLLRYSISSVPARLRNTLLRRTRAWSVIKLQSRCSSIRLRSAPPDTASARCLAPPSPMRLWPSFNSTSWSRTSLPSGCSLHIARASAASPASPMQLVVRSSTLNLGQAPRQSASASLPRSSSPIAFCGSSSALSFGRWPPPIPDQRDPIPLSRLNEHVIIRCSTLRF
mmetsp:Transcript_51819/g.116350  ORF Transcript_51819/g.116350 Transcript_51819/m.116350 type:complete len:215 (+) Transcript_51819:126-770(+)